MISLVRNSLAVIAGALVNTFVFLLFLRPIGIVLGQPDPPSYEDAGREDWEDFFASFSTIHFLGPLLAHFAGAFCGVFVASNFASTRGSTIPTILTLIILIHNVVHVFFTPAQPVWFQLIHPLIYIPAGYFSWKSACAYKRRKQKGNILGLSDQHNK